MIKLIGIKTNNGYLISDNVENKNYHSTRIDSLIINDSEPIKTFKNAWFRTESKPHKIQTLIKQEPQNQRWELKDKSLIGKFKEIYLANEVMEDYDYSDDFIEIKGLYEFKKDILPDILQDLEFEILEILEIEEFKEPVGFKYKRSGQWSNQKYPDVTEMDVKYDLVSQLLNPSIILHEHPCRLSVKESYDIVRAHVKENINPKVSEITSDYDFCFTVKKKIPLAKPYKYEFDANSLSSRKKKPKIETRIVDKKSVEIFEMCHAKYGGYTPINPFLGESLEDLKMNIDSYLENLMLIINEPVRECSNCSGAGVVFNEIK